MDTVTESQGASRDLACVPLLIYPYYKGKAAFTHSPFRIRSAAYSGNIRNNPLNGH